MDPERFTAPVPPSPLMFRPPTPVMAAPITAVLLLVVVIMSIPPPPLWRVTAMLESMNGLSALEFACRVPPLNISWLVVWLA